jgi:hypothetical protein
MRLTKLYMLPLVTVVVVASALLLKVPTAQSSDLYQSSSVSDSSEASDRIIDRQVLEEGQVFLFQTESEGVELIREAKVVTITQSYIVTAEDSDGEVIKVFQGLGRGSDLVSIATMSEAEALQLLTAGGSIVDSLKP